MTTARKHLVKTEVTPYYHCTSRCVRRTFLCGNDPLTGRSFEHRKDWIEQRLWSLSAIFCIDICAYAIMSNHYHLVVHINTYKAESLSNTEVLKRWEKIHKIPANLRLLFRKTTLNKQEKALINRHLSLWRQRLSSLSWFMRELNMGIAQQANKEDKCTGHFWESRYTSKALLDEQALISAMAYTDLNPIRANIATTPENSAYTSIQLRCKALKEEQPQPKPLAILSSAHYSNDTFTLPFSLCDYLKFVDWVGRLIKEDKPGAIPKNIPSILTRLNWPLETCCQSYRRFGQKGVQWIGSQESVNRAQLQLKRKKMKALRLS